MKTIPLTQGRVAIVDDEDYDRLSQFKWYADVNPSTGRFRALRKVTNNKTRIKIWMHREILGLLPGIQVDHRNLDSLDNRKENLRPATNQENSWNRSLRRDSFTGYKGVRRRTGYGRFQARICDALGRRLHLGCFDTAEEAAKAYDEAALKHFGEFARTNGVPA
jgi:hypothetical protein